MPIRMTSPLSVPFRDTVVARPIWPKRPNEIFQTTLYKSRENCWRGQRKIDLTPDRIGRVGTVNSCEAVELYALSY